MTDITKEIKEPSQPTKRGRPKSISNSVDAIEKRERKNRMDVATQGDRPKVRVGLTKTGRLGFPASVEKESDMHYCWALDDDKNNLQRYLDAWYEPALNREGKQEVRPAGGNGHRLILMKIKEEYYQEDYAKEQERCSDFVIESSSLKEGEYIPNGVKSVITKSLY